MICLMDIILFKWFCICTRGRNRARNGRKDDLVLAVYLMYGAVGCAVNSFRCDSPFFMKVPLHAFADALRPGTPR